jgi:predicted DNA-binding transcriptional regulator AlpA
MANHDPFHDRLWGIRELAAYLNYQESTLAGMVTKSPERLPPRVAPLGRPRWDPAAVRAWVASHSRQPAKKGRPRSAPTLTAM